MIPIENDKLVPVLSPEQAKRKQEILEFLDADCEWAEMWKNEKTSIPSNIDRYKAMARRMKVSHKITFHMRGDKVLARREKKGF